MDTKLRQSIDVVKFKGVDKFYDISPLLEDSTLLFHVIQRMYDLIAYQKIDCVCGLDARGFIFGTCLSKKLIKPFYMIRKEGKLPNAVVSDYYQKEYKSDNEKGERLAISKRADFKDKTVLIVDDSIATGGTMNTAVDLVKSMGATNIICIVLLKLKQFNTSPKRNNINLLYLLEDTDIIKKKSIYIGSTSIIKVSAVKNVFHKDKYNIYYDDVPSGVSEQPISFEETEKGANFRLNRIIEKYPENDIAIAIENGLVCVNNSWYDVGCIVIKTEKDRITTWTAMLPVEDNLIDLVHSTKQTIGDIIDPSNSKDPHSFATNKQVSRNQTLQQALKILIGKIGLNK